jgi:prepilin-type N-terminal cleavage/methylation domain-containing protein
MSAPRKFAKAFTLIEVLLAITILVGLLSVVLFFYQRAAQLRTELLAQTEQITTARLLMDRVTSELRAAKRHSYYAVPLIGDESSIQFITTSLPTVASWTGERLGRITRPESDLKLVTYATASATDTNSTNATGVTRREEPLVDFKADATATTVAPTNSAPSLVTDQLRMLRFRYWDGAKWQLFWAETRLPAAVEVTLGGGTPSPDAESEELPDDVFRRVIFLPGSAASAFASGGASATSTVSTESPEVLR